MEQIVLGLAKIQMADAVHEMEDQNFDLDLGRGGERSGDRGGRRSEGRDFGRGRDRDSGRSGSRERGGRFERSDRGDRPERGDRSERSERPERSERSFDRGPAREKGVREPGMARLFLNLGKKDRIRPNDIVGAIAGETGVPGRSIGGIDIFDNFSFVDVPSKDAEHVIKVMKNNTIKGITVNMEISKA
jgi:ATP-dependent RNA helicase DeaD